QFRASHGGGRPSRPYGRGRGRDCAGRDLDQGGRGEGYTGRAQRDGNTGGAHGVGHGGSHSDKAPADDHNRQGKEKPAGEPVSKKNKKFVLCCEICEEEHFTNQCPLLHGPKPAATYCGLAGDGLRFFHIPYTSAAKAPRKVSATALIKIIEGDVPADLVKSELARTILIKWDWVVQEHGKNTYIVPFLCQVELQRMISMRHLQTDINEGVMLFEKWNNEIKPKQNLQKIRSFLPLRGVGSILGATQRVDMRSMRKTGKQVVEQVIDTAVDKILEELSAKVAAE
uniref:DUF4283 domain-containing protein n=1 Tax=Setaria italica TaxID=4555 RepID=K3Y3C6_SETIT